eukprot:12565336-Alexandrium_andersonii.AAC.1
MPAAHLPVSTPQRAPLRQAVLGSLPPLSGLAGEPAGPPLAPLRVRPLAAWSWQLPAVRSGVGVSAPHTSAASLSDRR